MNRSLQPYSSTRRASSKLMLGLALAGAIGTIGATTGAWAVKAEQTDDASPAVLNLAETSKAFTEITKKVSPAVVHIKVEKRIPGITHQLEDNGRMMPFDEDRLKRFFGDRMPGFNFRMPELPRGDQFSIGQGSGSIITTDGYILTNSHVVADADKVTVTLADGREFEGQIIGNDARSDVAVVKIDGQDLPTLGLGDSDRVEVGEWVLAVGSPFGLTGTVTSGIVSAKGRSSVGITDYEDFIQTDAAINPGNSGGPLVNLKGEVIGINTAIFSRSGANNGIGFAIPINMAGEIRDQLIADGSVTRGYLGIMLQNLTPDLAASFGIENGSGVLVGDVMNGSPADDAGMKSGDVVVAFDGKDVHAMGEFRNLVAATQPDTKVDMVVMRDGKRLSLNVAVGRLAQATDSDSESSDSIQHLGLSVAPLNDEIRERNDWNQVSGVVVSGVQSGSPAARAGIRAGMLIQEVNRKEVHDMASFQSAIDQAQEAKRVLLRVRDGQYSRYLAVTWK